jgi:hypothetical protein
LTIVVSIIKPAKFRVFVMPDFIILPHLFPKEIMSALIMPDFKNEIATELSPLAMTRKPRKRNRKKQGQVWK